MLTVRPSRATLLLGLLLASACGGDKSAPPGIYDEQPGAGGEAGSGPVEPCAEPPEDPGDTSLAEAYGDHFKFGVALNGFTFFNPQGDRAQLAARQFNRVTAENSMKWSSLQPVEGEFDFEAADAFVEFAELYEMEVHGHVLVWHQQVPGWVFEDDDGGEIGRAGLLARLEEHMARLAERYAGRIAYWDVLNEAFQDDGSPRDTPWRRILGDDYIAEVFALADGYFPDAKLVYNDFSMFQPGKRAAVIRLVEQLRAADVRIDAVGMQGHYDMFRATVEELDEALSEYGDAGIDVLVTELDVDVLPRNFMGADLAQDMEGGFDDDPYSNCVPESVDEAIAERWRALFDVYLRHADTIRSVSVWGLEDGQSWLNNWPVEGRTNHALLFDRQLRPKSNYLSVIDAADN